MSLFATDEENAYCDGSAKGRIQGYREGLKDLKKWLEHDEGMISVESVRKKIDSLIGAL